MSKTGELIFTVSPHEQLLQSDAFNLRPDLSMPVRDEAVSKARVLRAAGYFPAESLLIINEHSEAAFDMGIKTPNEFNEVIHYLESYPLCLADGTVMKSEPSLWTLDRYTTKPQPVAYATNRYRLYQSPTGKVLSFRQFCADITPRPYIIWNNETIARDEIIFVIRTDGDDDISQAIDNLSARATDDCVSNFVLKRMVKFNGGAQTKWSHCRARAEASDINLTETEGIVAMGPFLNASIQETTKVHFTTGRACDFAATQSYIAYAFRHQQPFPYTLHTLMTDFSAHSPVIERLYIVEVEARGAQHFENAAGIVKQFRSILPHLKQRSERKVGH